MIYVLSYLTIIHDTWISTAKFDCNKLDCYEQRNRIIKSDKTSHYVFNGMYHYYIFSVTKVIKNH